jgi:hypothetical protein
MTPAASLVSLLRETASSFGLTFETPSPTLVRAAQDAVVSKWMLGGRKASYRASCMLDEATQVAAFREVLTESSWGVPPPAITIATTSQKGAAVRKSVTVTGPGGGKVDLGAARDAFERAVTTAGWRFAFESGKLPA